MMLRQLLLFTVALGFFAVSTVGQDTLAGDQVVVLALAETEQEGGTIDIETDKGEEFSSIEAPAAKVKDKQIKSLRLGDLRRLNKALDDSAKLANLKELHINFCWTGPRVLSEGELTKIAAIETLEVLTLADTTVEPKQLDLLAKLPNIKSIKLEEITSRGAFTDAHLQRLAGIEELTAMDVSRTHAISSKGVAAFQKARPKCKVVAPMKRRK